MLFVCIHDTHVKGEQMDKNKNKSQVPQKDVNIDLPFRFTLPYYLFYLLNLVKLVLLFSF